ncbi:cytochrome P450 4C1-like [Cylas formicarius]|uniref:cytochrome P450 4C1-like n=1 Tax=Cylas formicarius TaxID=197179 RepID=UPI002958A66B|nr:cytochrome P450 4C1-like [Cylas formicarius]
MHLLISDVWIALAVILLTVAVCFPVWKFYKKRKELAKAVDAFPGPRWYPLIGTSLELVMTSREERWNLIKKWYQEYPRVMRMWIGFKPMIQLSKPEHLEIIFKSHVNINKGMTYQYLMPWLGGGLITAAGEKWKEHRRLLTPAFHFKILDKYSEIFSEKARELVEIFKEKVNAGHFDASPYFTRCALDIISETAMGVKFNSLKDPTSDYANAIFGLCEIVAIRESNPFYAIDIIFNCSNDGKRYYKYLKTIQETTYKIVSDRRKKFQKHGTEQNVDELGRKEKLTFLDILLVNEQENKFTDKEIADEVNTFMFTGQDTTASTVMYTLLALGNYMDIQAKVQEELDNIFNGEDRSITPQDIAEMEYLDRVIKETLRKFTFVPGVARVLDKDIVIDGQRIPADVSLLLSLYKLHHDPDYWPDPDRFDPDRFLPDAASKRHPYAFAPFSAGSRNCIGQKFGTRNSKTILAAILRKFKVKCLEDPETLQEYTEIVLRPQNGLHLELELRK